MNQKQSVHVLCTLLTAAATVFSSHAKAQTCVAGIQASNPSSVYVIDAANGTVTDIRTGLMWDRCSRGQSGAACGAGSASALNWAAALDVPATIGFYKGYNDWRLPNVKELRSLVEECRINPSINEFAFPATPALNFWSGSPVAATNTLFSWDVGFDFGYDDISSRAVTSLVRLVRAGH
jgi:Protein of unknown function (DUF1566)